MVRLFIKDGDVLVSLLGEVYRAAESEDASSDYDNRGVFLRQGHINIHLLVSLSFGRGDSNLTEDVWGGSGTALLGASSESFVDIMYRVFRTSRCSLLPTTIMSGMDHGISLIISWFLISDLDTTGIICIA